MKNVVVVGNAEYLVNGTTAILTIFRGTSEEVVLTSKIKGDENEYSVEIYGENSFAFAGKLKNLFFKGTEAEWSSINTSLANFANEEIKVYFYSEEEPADDSTGLYWHYNNSQKPVIWKKA